MIKRFRQWQKERYFRKVFFEEIIPHHTYYYASYIADGGKPPTQVKLLTNALSDAIRLTRAHFNDHTFQPKRSSELP